MTIYRVSQVENRSVQQDLMRWQPQPVEHPLPSQASAGSLPTLVHHQVQAEVSGSLPAVFIPAASMSIMFLSDCLLLIFIFSVNPLSFLRNQPQFHVMRQLIQQNAALLPALLQEIGRENPELLQVTELDVVHDNYVFMVEN